jgi:uncharacterized protein YbjT (DUF2867 family)/uncharacterized membrane protein YphA (DoxX/SURF4 family)
MRVLVTGGYGFIGAAICARLYAQGHEVIGAGRRVDWARHRYSGWSWVFCDFNQDIFADLWLDRLKHIDVVINCVGVLQDGGRDNTQNAHVKGLKALLEACEKSGVQKFIHFSAVGADPAAGTAYARSKHQGAELVMASKLNWVILEPSLVLDRNAYGGSALIRLLAGLPGIIPLVYGKTSFQPIHMRDLTQIVSRLLVENAPDKIRMELAGPEPYSLEGIILIIRKWLGFGEVKFVAIPDWLAAPIFTLGDFLGAVGIRNAFCTTAKKQMQYDVGGDPGQIEALLGYKVRSVEACFNADPATSGDRKQARSAFWLAAGRIILAFYWMLSGLIPLLFSKQAAFAILETAGLPQSSHFMVWMFGGLMDVLLGGLLLFGVYVRRVCVAMIVVTIGYISVITLTIPELWLDPLASVIKVFPMVALAALIASQQNER